MGKWPQLAQRSWLPLQGAGSHTGSWCTGAGSSVAWGRDQDVALDFPTLAKALAKVARGEVSWQGAGGHAAQLQCSTPGCCTTEFGGLVGCICRICSCSFDALHPCNVVPQLECTKENFEQRVFFMVDRDM